MKFEIKSWLAGKVLFEMESESMKLCLEAAVKLKVDLSYASLVRASLDGASLYGASLDGARLDGASLDGASLVRASLDGASLYGASLDGASLVRASLVRASLDGARLDGARLDGASLVRASLDGASLVRASLDGVPVIKNIHRAVYEAASRPGCLNMKDWHTCSTTHCRAGWVVTLAGEEGRKLEASSNTPSAAALIYLKSDPTLENIPDFNASNEDALADMKALAEAEAAQ